MNIKLYDELQSHSAVSTNEGDKIYSILESEINRITSNNQSENNEIIIDFSNIDDLTTAFLNNSIAKLFYNFNTDSLFKILRFTGFTKGNHIKLLKLSISNVMNTKK